MYLEIGGNAHESNMAKIINDPAHNGLGFFHGPSFCGDSFLLLSWRRAARDFPSPQEATAFLFLLPYFSRFTVVSVVQVSGIQTLRAVSSCNRSPSVQSAEASPGELIKKTECRFDLRVSYSLGWDDLT